MTIHDLKDKTVASVRMWAEERIDDLANTNPKLTVASVYMKRGVKNWLSKEGYRIDNLIDNAAIFVCDENGNVNMETLFADMLSVFKNMEEVPFEHGLLKGTIGKGVIRIALPDNPLVAFLFGETGALKVTDTDLLELKALFAENETE